MTQTETIRAKVKRKLRRGGINIRCSVEQEKLGCCGGEEEEEEGTTGGGGTDERSGGGLEGGNGAEGRRGRYWRDINTLERSTGYTGKKGEGVEGR